jgi:hypothetical protein
MNSFVALLDNFHHSTVLSRDTGTVCGGRSISSTVSDQVGERRLTSMEFVLESTEKTSEEKGAEIRAAVNLAPLRMASQSQPYLLSSTR